MATAGQYSDYRVLAVFTDEALASKVGDDVLELDLWDKVPAPKVSYVIREHPPLSTDPEVVRHQLLPWDYSYESMNFGRRPVVELWGRLGGIMVSGGVREAVVKAYHDRRNQLLAMEAGVA